MEMSSAALPQMRVQSPNDLISGRYRKYYILGFPTADSNNSLEMAVKNALTKSPQASTLINVFMENKITDYLIFATEDIQVTGTPVVINDSKSAAELLSESKS